jgi:hypothetical protein
VAENLPLLEKYLFQQLRIPLPPSACPASPTTVDEAIFIVLKSQK